MTFRLSEQQRAARLNEEVADWSQRGYRVVTMSRTSAQLVKPKPSMFVPALVLLVLSLLIFVVAGFPIAAVVFLIGLVFLVILHAGRKEPLIFLSIDEEGSIVEH